MRARARLAVLLVNVLLLAVAGAGCGCAQPVVVPPFDAGADDGGAEADAGLFDGGAAHDAGPPACAGCVNASGACVQAPDNTHHTSCGAGGRACLNCAAAWLVCNPTTFSCEAYVPPDAGPPPCTGCVADGGTCYRLPASTNHVTCGHGGGACVDCTTTGQLCDAQGQCYFPGPAAWLGMPCTSTPQCGSLGPGATCKLTTSNGGAYPHGFCTLPCPSGACDGGVCTGGPGTLPALYGEAGAFCVPSCSAVGAACPQTPLTCLANAGDLTSAPATPGCWLDPNAPELPPYTGGGAPTKLGQACVTELDCANPPDRAVAICVPERLPDGGASGFTGGACFADCNLDHTGTFCGTGFCLAVFGTATDPSLACVAGCTSPGAGRLSATPTDRLHDYVCRTQRLADGGVAGGRQWPACDAPGWRCSTTGYPACNATTGYCCAATGSTNCLN